MKRLHVHVSVDDLAQSVWFYSTLFAAASAVTKADYVKWMLDDPQGVSWETFLTTGDSTVYGESADLGAIRTTAAVCCTPKTPQSACCTPKPELAPTAACCAS